MKPKNCTDYWLTAIALTAGGCASCNTANPNVSASSVATMSSLTITLSSDRFLGIAIFECEDTQRHTLHWKLLDRMEGVPDTVVGEGELPNIAIHDLTSDWINEIDSYPVWARDGSNDSTKNLHGCISFVSSKEGFVSKRLFDDRLIPSPNHNQGTALKEFRGAMPRKYRDRWYRKYIVNGPFEGILPNSDSGAPLPSNSAESR